MSNHVLRGLSVSLCAMVLASAPAVSSAAEAPAKPAAAPAPGAKSTAELAADAAAKQKAAAEKRGSAVRTEIESIRKTQLPMLATRYEKAGGALKTASDQAQATLKARAELLEKLAAACDKLDYDAVKAIEPEVAKSSLALRTKTDVLSARAREAEYINEGQVGTWQTQYPEATEELNLLVASRKAAAAAAGKWAQAVEDGVTGEPLDELRDAFLYADATASATLKYFQSQGDCKHRRALATAKKAPQAMLDAYTQAEKTNAEIFAAAKEVATKNDLINTLTRARNKAMLAASAAATPAPAPATAKPAPPKPAPAAPSPMK